MAPRGMVERRQAGEVRPTSHNDNHGAQRMYLPNLKHLTAAPEKPPDPPYSFSQLTILEQCPRRYFLQYISKQEQKPDSDALRLGRVVHDRLEAGLLAYLAEWLASGAAGYDHAALGRYLSNAELCGDKPFPDDLRATTVATLLNVWAWFADDMGGGLPRWQAFGNLGDTLVEQGMYIARDGRCFPWSGDRAEVHPEGFIRLLIDFGAVPKRGQGTTGIVVDWKSGKNPYFVRGGKGVREQAKIAEILGDMFRGVEGCEPLPPVHRQLSLYAHALFTKYPWLTTVRATFFNCRIKPDAEEPATITPEDARRDGWQWAVDLVDTLADRDWCNVAEWEPRENDLCFFCDWSRGCPLKEKQRKAAKFIFRGILKRVIMTSDKGTDWRLMEFDVADADKKTSDLMVLGGILSTPVIGAQYEFGGDWGEYRGKPSFQVEPRDNFRQLRAVGEAAIMKILTEVIWIGKSNAEKLVGIYGDAAMDELEKDPDLVAAAMAGSGLTPKRARQAASQIKEQRTMLEAEAALIEMLPETHRTVIRRILRAYGESAIDRIKADPYQLTSAYGIGWESVDSVAESLGIRGADKRRLRAGILHLMKKAEGDGHTCVNGGDFVIDVEMLLSVDGEEVRAQISRMLPAGTGELVVSKGGRLWRAFRDDEEAAIAEELYRVWRYTARDLGNYSEAKVADLNERQRAAVVGTLEHGCAVWTGGPGTGKTYTLNTFLKCLPDRFRVAQGAPTGQAAKRMTLATGMDASTIHSLLSPDPASIDVAAGVWGFQYNQDNPLPLDCLILDETSMQDHSLALAVLLALPKGCWLVLIGDADQIPAVGPGDYFRSLVEAMMLPTFWLTEVHRNAGIGREVCKSIIAGEMPTFGDIKGAYDPQGNNCWMMPCKAENQPDMIKRLVTKWAPSKGFDPLTDVMILTANSKKIGDVCAPVLNRKIQAALNPHGTETKRKDYKAEVNWRNGDRLINTRNDYEADLVNGDLLTIIDVEKNGDSAETITVLPDGWAESEAIEATEDMQLAYAMTVHKAQGSQARLVIVAVDWDSQKTVLSRQLLYTAISRFSEACFVLVSGGRANLAQVIQKSDAKRRTGLPARLEGLCAQFSNPPTPKTEEEEAGE